MEPDFLVEIIFFDRAATVNVLTVSNNDVKLVEIRTVHCARLKSS